MSGFSLERTELARRDLDWIPARYKALRWAVTSAIGTAALAPVAAAAIALKGFVFYYGKGLIALVAGSYYAGDRMARRTLRRRLGRLASGEANLARLARREDGELVHVSGRVRAMETFGGLLGGEGAVFRRTVFSCGDVRVVHEAAVDFLLDDGTGEAVLVQTAGARLLVPEPSRRKLGVEEAMPLLALPLPQATARWMAVRKKRLHRGHGVRPVPAGEVLVRDGDEVTVLGYKSRVVDAAVASRLERDIPTRPVLRAGRDLPLLVAVADVRGGRRVLGTGA